MDKFTQAFNEMMGIQDEEPIILEKAKEKDLPALKEEDKILKSFDGDLNKANKMAYDLHKHLMLMTRQYKQFPYSKNKVTKTVPRFESMGANLSDKIDEFLTLVHDHHSNIQDMALEIEEEMQNK